MQRIRLSGSGVVFEDDAPDLGLPPAGMVKVEVKACGICGSDLSLLRGTRDRTKETYFGHEFSGRITAVGSGALELPAGTRVATELARTCGRCRSCRNGLPNYCRSMNDALSPGGFAGESLIRAEDAYSFLSPIPEELDDVTAALLEPVSCAYRIASQARLSPGGRVLIMGLGAMGLFTAVILRSWGAGSIIGVDTNRPRRDTAGKLGVLNEVSPGGEEIRSMGDRGDAPDVVIEATGAPEALGDAMQAVRCGGRIVVAGVYGRPANELYLTPIMRKELVIVGAKGPFPSKLTDGTSAPLAALVANRDIFSKMITVYDSRHGAEAFRDMLEGRALKAVIKF